MATTPWRARSLATKEMRRMFSSRSSLENPRPLVRRSRTSSPSRTSTGQARRLNSPSSRRARVLLPALGKPVNHTTNPSVAMPCPFLAVLSPRTPERSLLDVAERSQGALRVLVHALGLLGTHQAGGLGQDPREGVQVPAQGRGGGRRLPAEVRAIQGVAEAIVDLLAPRPGAD